MAAAAALVFLTACRVDVDLGVRVDEDGSGTVQIRFLLDREAVAALEDPLEEQLRVADLVQAGWRVDVRHREGEGAEVTAAKDFSAPEELTAVVDELSGRVGPFHDFQLRRTRSRFRTELRFSGQVDLTHGVGRSLVDPADEGLRLELEDRGLTARQLGEFLGRRLDRVVSFRVLVALPGNASSNAPEEVAGAPRWEPRVGEVAELEASSSVLDLARVARLVGGSLAGLAALVLLAVGVRSGRRGRGWTGPAPAARVGRGDASGRLP